MKAKIKRVLVLEIEEKSPEYDVLVRLINLGKQDMLRLDFSEEDYKASANIQSEILNQRR